MAYVSEVTLIVTWIAALLVMTGLFEVPTFHATRVHAPSLAAPNHRSALHCTPTHKNSRSTRRERRNQQSIRLVV